MRTTVFGITLMFLAIPGIAMAADEIMVTPYFDFGAIVPYVADGNIVTFELRDKVDKNKCHLTCLIESSAKELELRFHFSENGYDLLEKQGMFISQDGLKYECIPFCKLDEETMAVTVTLSNGGIFISTAHPYGRDRLEELIADTANRIKDSHWVFLHSSGRIVPIFELGTDDGKKMVHYILAEDERETGSQWVADRMIRELVNNSKLSKKLSKEAVLRICPTESPYTLTTDSGSYTNMQGLSRYGGGSWGRTPQPPEIAVLYKMITQTISEKRLGLMLTIHCWHGQHDYTDIETVKSGGENTLSQARVDWAKAAMDRLTDGVPYAKVTLSEKAWYEGLLRHDLMAKHNVISFRMEVTTHYPYPFEQTYTNTAKALLSNLAKIDDWTPVLDSVKR